MARNHWKKLIANVRQNSIWLIRNGDPSNPKHWRDPTTGNNRQREQWKRGEIDASEITGEWMRERCEKSKTKKTRYCFLQWEDLEKLWIRQNYRCAWLGIPVDLNEIHVANSPYAISVDRINDDADYTVDNIMLTTRFANLGRCRSNMEQTREFINGLIDHFTEHEKYQGGVDREFVPGITVNENYKPKPIKQLF